MLYSFSFTLFACVASAHILASRQVGLCGSQPVDCGEGWCCSLGFTCATDSEDAFICIDQILTNEDGSPMTEPAQNPSSLFSVISSAQGTLSVPTVSVTEFPAPTTTSNPNLSLTSSSATSTRSLTLASSLTTSPGTSTQSTTESRSLTTSRETSTQSVTETSKSAISTTASDTTITSKATTTVPNSSTSRGSTSSSANPQRTTSASQGVARPGKGTWRVAAGLAVMISLFSITTVGRLF